ncbi:hypothetical protein AX16_004354 [Volvariella volvacea WC 439]|nr:hypothetical protein AX16_004354 [Volvariella volvacea WC 439]
MSDSTLRRRKKEQTSRALPQDGAHDEAPGRHGTEEEEDEAAIVLKLVKYLWAPLLLGLLSFLYTNPDVVTELTQDWLGSSGLGQATAPSEVQELYMGADEQKRDAIVAAFKHAWWAYERDAMGADEYHPLSKQGSNLTEAGGIGYTVVDALDTILLMGLRDEYARARRWVSQKLSFDRDDAFNTFEVTIRVLGGLLSAYHLTAKDSLYLEKAIELADRILPAFETPSGLPLPRINLAKRQGLNDREFPGLVSTAEVSTLQLEFRYLSHVTESDVYWRTAEKVMRLIKEARLPHGMASIFMSVNEGTYVESAIRLGSRGDSFYEYLLKQHLQTNRTENVYRDMYDDAMDGIHNYLIQTTHSGRLTYTSELVPEQDGSGALSWRLTPKQDHLVCFLGGSLLLGAVKTGATVPKVSIPPRKEELTLKGARDWKTGTELIRTCMKTHDTATGLSPEVAHFRIASDGMDAMPNAPEDWYIKGAAPGAPAPYDARYMLRPETIESLFIAYRLTGDPIYREHGWEIFKAIEKHCRVPTGGYATVTNVDEVPAKQEDKMETFMLSETLKYLFLLFSDSKVLPLDRYVLNTEVSNGLPFAADFMNAITDGFIGLSLLLLLYSIFFLQAHPLPIFNPTLRTGFA